jgi:hypothetical protein
VADRYLDALLAAGDRRALDTPADPALDAELRDTARVLRRSLVRVHPSFRFEERLAARLAAFAVAQGRDTGSVEGDGTLLPFVRPDARSEAADPWLAAIVAGRADPANESTMPDEPRVTSARRPLIVGGALTSAALSIVGVAWFAWRASRASARSMTAPIPGAVHVVHSGRHAVAGLSGSGLGGPA